MTSTAVAMFSSNKNTPSIFSAIQKMNELLTRKEKIKWFIIIGFALVGSILELVTASIIVMFAQVLNDPLVGQKYIQKLGIMDAVSPGKIVFYMAMAFGVAYLVKNLVAAAEVFYQNLSIQKMCYQFKNKLLYRYAYSDYGFYLTRNSSFGSQVVGSDTEKVFSNGMLTLSSLVSEAIVFISLVSMIIYMHPSLALIIFAIGGAFSLLISKFLLPQFYHWGQKIQQTIIGSNQNLMQFFHAFKEIVLLGQKESFVDAYQVHSRRQSKVLAIQTATNALPRMVLEIIFVCIFVITITFLSLSSEGLQQMIGILGGYLYIGFRLMPGLNRIINQLNTFKSSIPSINRVHQEYTTVTTDKHYLDIPKFNFDKSITFKGVDFKYLNTDKNALSSVQLTINKGECIGVVGETGSGKSTLIDLLLGLLRPSVGKVLVDDKYPVNSIQWHQKIGYVPQAVYLVDDTIEANIAFGEQDVDQDRLDKAIYAAQLRKLIDSLPQASKTIVGERGIRLSGGERQRIAIARALYRESEVLIFDEATSSLDNETESRLMETIHAVSHDRTVIMIAHRLTTLKDCDRIVEMDKGSINSTYSYEHIKNKKGRYVKA